MSLWVIWGHPNKVTSNLYDVDRIVIFISLIFQAPLIESAATLQESLLYTEYKSLGFVVIRWLIPGIYGLKNLQQQSKTIYVIEWNASTEFHPPHHLSDRLLQRDHLNVWFFANKCTRVRRKRGLLSSLERCDPSSRRPDCHWSIQSGSNGDSRLHRCRLLTLVDSIDSFINPYLRVIFLFCLFVCSFFLTPTLGSDNLCHDTRFFCSPLWWERGLCCSRIRGIIQMSNCNGKGISK